MFVKKGYVEVKVDSTLVRTMHGENPFWSIDGEAAIIESDLLETLRKGATQRDLKILKAITRFNETEKMDFKYPEHGKMMVVRDESHAISRFLAWLRTHSSEEFSLKTATHADIESILSTYYGVDEGILALEKIRLLSEILGEVALNPEDQIHG